jgi:hypothetical protein
MKIAVPERPAAVDDAAKQAKAAAWFQTASE